MIHVVTQENRSLYQTELEDMFAMRYRAAVQEMGWVLDTPQDGYDKDEFDFEDTIYFLYFNADGSVGACGRLNPSTRRHLLSEVFAQMCENGVPQSEDIFEYSRYLVERKGKTQREYMKAWMLITQAVNEFCIENAITSVSWLARKRLYSLSTYLWDTKPLGLPQYYKDDRTEYIAAISKMDTAGLARVQEYSKVTEPVASMVVPLHCASRLSASPLIRRAS